MIQIPKLLLSAIDSPKKIIIIGTYWEYGYSAKKYKFIPTDAPIIPTNAYAGSNLYHFKSNSGRLQHKITLSIELDKFLEKDCKSSNRLWPSLHKATTNGDDFHLTSGEQIRDFS